MKKVKIGAITLKTEDKSRFPVHVEMKGDDFSFEIEISMFMAGKIIEYIGAERERIAKIVTPYKS